MTVTLGHIQFDTPVMLAPMSGISDYPFRRLVKSFGADMVFSEMIASQAVIQEYTASKRNMANYEDEHPVAVQLAGCDPDIMAQAAKINADRGADIIDINFGCPVKKIVKKFAGSALMKDEDLAVRIIESVVNAVDIPVTVKMRLGWDKEHLNAPSLARKAQDVGAQMITVHGRTRDQLYSGNADWTAIKSVKQAVSIPVIVNGDIECIDDAKVAMEQSDADGVMIGRGVSGRPWFLRQLMDYLHDGTLTPEPSPEIKTATIIGHYKHMLDYYGTHKGMEIARKHLSWYCNGMDNAGHFRRQINQETNPQAVQTLIQTYFSENY